MKSANFILRALILFIYFVMGGGGGLEGESSSKKVTAIKMTHVKKIGKLKGGLLRCLNGASHKKNKRSLVFANTSFDCHSNVKSCAPINRIVKPVKPLGLTINVLNDCFYSRMLSAGAFRARTSRS